jgi:tripartite-type tricarboxylate transporter receptor subunit TctC
LAGLPEVPPIAETLPGYEVMAWAGLMVPAKTPGEMVETVHKAAVAVLGRPEISKRLEDLGYLVVASRPDAMQAYVKAEIDKYATIIRQVGMQLQ